MRVLNHASHLRSAPQFTFFLLLTCLIWLPDPAVARDVRVGNATPPAIHLTCGGGAQFEIQGPGGQRVFTDVTDPTLLSSPATDKDVLLTTHFDFDHFNQKFVDTFPGEHLHGREGEIRRPGLSIRSIGGHHSELAWQSIKTSEGSNILFVIEMAGIRIAHFGDIGQPRLTAGQLEALGRIDVAITQFVNQYSQMDLENQKGYRLMDQVGPRLIIPHHGAGSEAAIRLALNRWRVVCAAEAKITLSRRELPKETTVLLMGELAEYIQKTFDLKSWPVK